MENEEVKQSWSFYAIAVVAENKPLTTNKIFATPVEIVNFSQGELKADRADVEVKGVDASGKEYQLKVRAVGAQEYDWLPCGYQHTAPDVRRGERVFIYRYADTDKFYWVESGLDRRFRRLETTTYMWQADPDAKDDDPWTEENCYMLEVSTHSKLVTFSTSQKNKEPFKYVFQLNTAEGFFSITDQDNNVIQLNSAEQIIHLQNKNGTHWVLDKDNLVGKAIANIIVEAGEGISFTSKTFSIKAEESISFDTKVWAVKATTSTAIESPTIKFKGNIEHEGNQTTSGAMAIGGGASVEGAMKNNGKDIGSEHTHEGPASAPSGAVSPTGKPV